MEFLHYSPIGSEPKTPARKWVQLPAKIGATQVCQLQIVSNGGFTPDLCAKCVPTPRDRAPSSIAFNGCKNISNLLIQRMFDKRKAPHPTSARKAKNRIRIQQVAGSESRRVTLLRGKRSIEGARTLVGLGCSWTLFGPYDVGRTSTAYV